MPASTLPIFTISNKQLGQQPGKAALNTGPEPSGRGFSQMFDQVQAKPKAAGKTTADSKKADGQIPGGKELPQQRPLKKAGQQMESSQTQGQSRSKNGNSPSTAAKDPATPDGTWAAQEPEDASVPSGTWAAQEPEEASATLQSQTTTKIPAEDAKTDTAFWLQQARVQWGLDTDGADISSLAADALGEEIEETDAQPCMPELASQDVPPLTNETAPPAELLSADVSNILNQLGFAQSPDTNEFAQTDDSRQVPLNVDANETQAQPIVLEHVDKSEVEVAYIASDANTDLDSKQKTTQAPLQMQGEIQAKSSQQNQDELVEIEPKTSRASPPTQEPEHKSDSKTDSNPDQPAAQSPIQMQGNASQHNDQAAPSESKGVKTPTPAATSSQGVSSKAQSTAFRQEAGAERGKGQAVASSPAGEINLEDRLEAATQDTAFETRPETGESGERTTSQATAAEPVKNFSQLLAAGMGRHQPEALAAARTQVSDLPPQLRSLDAPMGTKAWEQGVGERIHWMVNNGASSAEIRLNPQHLGPLSIRISLHNDQTQVSILAQHGATRDAIEASLPRLREMFQDANLNLGNVDVGRREAQQQGPGQNQGQNFSQTQEQASENSGRSRGYMADADENLTNNSTANRMRRVSTALIDDFA